MNHDPAARRASSAAITPFNFPAMIPLWFLPYAIACGNTFILKPSERVPLTQVKIFELIEKTGLPKGVVNIVIGGKPAVDALLHHPEVHAISFVGSTPVARYIYRRSGERQARAVPGRSQESRRRYAGRGPRNERQDRCDSAFGCAGQRCLAVSVAVTVGDAQSGSARRSPIRPASLRLGNGLADGVQMGPVITPASRQRIRVAHRKGRERRRENCCWTAPQGAHGHERQLHRTHRARRHASQRSELTKPKFSVRSLA